MSSCWKLDAAMRPKFSGLVTTINSLLEKDSGYLELLNLPSFEASSLPFIGKSFRSDLGYVKFASVLYSPACCSSVGRCVLRLL